MMLARIGKITVVCAFVLSLGVLAAAAAKTPANVAGKWEMSMQGRRGTMTQTLTLQQDGAKIKGTLTSRRGESPVEGKVDGNKIEFTVKRETPRGEFTQDFKGSVDGDAMKGTVHMFRFDINWTAKKEQ